MDVESKRDAARIGPPTDRAAFSRFRAPAFDLNPNPRTAAFATAVGGVVERDVDAVLAVAPDFRLTPGRAEVIRREVEDAVRSWRTVAASARISPR